MADGCNLYLTPGDLKQIEESLDKPTRDRVCDAVDTAFKGNAEALAKKVSYPLSDPRDPAHKVFRDYVLRNVQGNESIPDHYKGQLPKAVARIARHTPDVVGLVRPASRSGPGATSSDRNLGHRKQGAAYAYELLQTARFMDHPSKPSNGGKEFKIHDTDRVDLGVKLQARYRGAENTFPHRISHRTCEADAFVQRAGAEAPIGIDFKHSLRAGEYSSIKPDQIDRIKTAIRTGEVKEFHFVTNGHFSKAIRERVEAANNELKESGKVNISIALHEKQRPRT